MRIGRYMRLMASLLSVVILAGLLAGCAATDVVARYASASFVEVTTAMDASVDDGYYSVVSQAGDVFRLAVDFSGTADAQVSIDAAPFITAGMDTARLPASRNSAWTYEDGRLIGRFDIAPGGRSTSAEPEAVMAVVAATARSRISYHAQMGHYGIILDDYVMVEWAADARKNDKDWVVVLDPGFVAATGGNFEAVQGWIPAMVPVDGPDGKMVEVQKLLRPLDIIP
jgi:hypothetical protein